MISVEKEFEIQDKVRANADRYFYGIQGAKMELNESDAQNLMPPNLNLPSSSSGAKLPKITVPTFDGNIRSWPAYFDLF